MTNIRGLVRLVISGVVLTSLSSQGADAPKSSSDEIKALQEEIRQMQQGQAAIQKDIAEIKRLLQTSQAGQPAQPVNTVVSVEGEPFKGDKNAKVTLIEFTEYQCPFSGRHARNTFPQLDKDYVATGKVKYVFKDFPLDFHKNAAKAAEAAHCAGEQGKYWEMHDRLFANQQSLALTNLPTHAEAIGLDVAKFQQCLDSGKYAAAIKKDLEEGAKSGVTGTPGFLLGLTQTNAGTVKVVKVLKGAKPYDDFKAAIDELLATGK